MYGPEAQRRRRCTDTRQDGQPCRAWALWDDSDQLCVNHAGRGHRGPMPWPPAWSTRVRGRANYEPCVCIAYQWPHRPGGGLCEWPNLPRWRCTSPAGTRSWAHESRRNRRPRIRLR
jgi:hypothetical protein